MIEQIIKYINQKLMQTTLFKDVRGLCEIIDKEDKKFPAEYFKGGEFKNIDDKTNWEVGVAYHRLLGDVEDEQLADEFSPTACDVAIRKTYHLKLVCCVPKTVLSNSNDDQYIDTKLVHNLENVLNEQKNSILENLLKLSLVQVIVKRADVNRYNVFKDEYQNVKFNIGFEYAYFALEYDIILEGLNSCFEQYTCDCGVSENYDFCTLCPQQPVPGCEGCDIVDNLHVPVNIHLNTGDSWICTPYTPFVDVVITDDLNPLSPISKGSGTTYSCVACPACPDSIITDTFNPLSPISLPSGDPYSCVIPDDSIITDALNPASPVSLAPEAPYTCFNINTATCQQLNDNLTTAQRLVVYKILSTKTGQTTSYAAGDDGALQNGRGAGFNVLSCNNSYGDTIRFKTPVANYTEDWQHRRAWYTVVQPVTLWANIPAAIVALNALLPAGFVDWYWPNIKELNEPVEYENGNIGCLKKSLNIAQSTPYYLVSSTTNEAANTQCFGVYARAITQPVSYICAKTTPYFFIITRKF